MLSPELSSELESLLTYFQHIGTEVHWCVDPESMVSRIAEHAHGECIAIFPSLQAVSNVYHGLKKFGFDYAGVGKIEGKRRGLFFRRKTVVELKLADANLSYLQGISPKCIFVCL